MTKWTINRLLFAQSERNLLHVLVETTVTTKSYINLVTKSFQHSVLNLNQDSLDYTLPKYVP